MENDLPWISITSKLNIGDHIKNWTLFKGYDGEDIIINKITPNSIDVETPNKNNQNLKIISVPKCAFAELYKNWNLYLDKKITRKYLSSSNFYSRYIIDIFHHLQIK